MENRFGVANQGSQVLEDATPRARGEGRESPRRAEVTRRNLEVHVASGDRLDVREFEVTEAMSTLFTVSLRAVAANPDVAFDAVVGGAASFTALGPHGAVATWTGICTEVRQVAVEPSGLSTYHLTIAPTLWLASQRRNYRLFQQISEIDIVRKLLAEWGIPFVERLRGAYKKRSYRAQYGESDLAFLSRLLEDAGVSYYFERDGDETRLVLCDAPQGNEPRARRLPFRDNPTEASEEHATRVEITQQVRPGRYTMRDHDDRLAPTYTLAASAARGAGVESRLERYHYTPGAFLFESERGEETPFADDRGRHRSDEAEAAELAQKRLEAQRAGAVSCVFETAALDLAPGQVVGLLDHPRRDLGDDRQLLVVASTFSGAHSGAWTHRCKAFSAEVPYRPALATPRPKVNGVESATVVGSPGEEIHTDEFGRVRVQFHWDREGTRDAGSSCWIPVSQPWGGAGFGGTNLPRVGQEVIVDFLGGDPDRPVIVGRVYNNLQKTPYKLPENRTQSGWKSASTGGGGGYNELMFEDSAGGELLRMQAQRDMSKLVKHDETSTVGNDRTRVVKRDESVTVNQDRTLQVDRDESTTIGRDRTEKVLQDEHLDIAHDRTDFVHHDERREVGNDRERVVRHDERITIDNDRTETIGRDEALLTQRDRTRTVKENERVQIGMNQSASIGLNRSASVGLDDLVTVGVRHLTAIVPAESGAPAGEPTSLMMIDKKIVFTTGAGATITLEGATVTIDADAIIFHAKKTLDARADEEHVRIQAKTEVVLHSEQKLDVLTDAGMLRIWAEGGPVSVSAGAGQDVVMSAAKDVVIAAVEKAMVGGNTSALVSTAETKISSMSGDVKINGGPWVKINS